MIFDKIENITKYGIDLGFVLDDLRNNNFRRGKFEVGKFGCFGIGLEYETKDSSEGVWEAHRKYLDIHVISEGEEYIHITDIENMQSIKEYEDDYELFDGPTEHKILLKEGFCLILFPNEVHKTSVKVIDRITVRKNVYKKQL